MICVDNAQHFFFLQNILFFLGFYQRNISHMYLMDSAILWNFASFERFKKITKYNVYKRVNDMDYLLLWYSSDTVFICTVYKFHFIASKYVQVLMCTPKKWQNSQPVDGGH
jgi:hypothetical protein